MNDVTVVTSVTYPSPESLALVADVQYHEPYLSAALNRKFRGIVDPGFYAGFFPKPGGGMNLLITSVDGDKTAGAASVNIGEFYQVTIQQRKDISLALSAGKKYAIVLKGRYLLGEDSYQVNTASHIHAAEFVARTYTDSYQLGDGELLVCTVNIPAGVSAITKEMIDVSDRIDLAIGIEISDSVTSTRSDVAASSLAVKKAYDLAKSKYTAQDASTTQKGLVQLSSATNSDSETMAATPKAVKSVKELADTKAPIESPSLTGTPTAPTAAQGTNSTQIANTAFVKAAITALINGAPGTLDTLKEIAAAINNDPNFSTTINNALALKAPLASPALTGIPTAPTAAQGTNNTQIATTAYVRAAISALVGSSPEALDTLNELAAALGNDPNFATTMTNALAGKQPLDATLTALAGLATGANKLPYFTGTDTVSQTDLTSVGRDILAKTSTLAVIQYLGLREIGTSGEKIPLLSTANTWSSQQTFKGKTAFSAAATFSAGIAGAIDPEDIGGQTVDLNNLTIRSDVGAIKYYYCPTIGGGAKITNKPDGVNGNFLLRVESTRKVSASDYANMQTLISNDTKRIYVRFVVDGSWAAWSQVVVSGWGQDVSVKSLSAVALSGSLTGNASTATKLQTARTINGVKFDGSANISIPTIASRGRVTALTDTTQGASTGLQMYEAYNNSYPTAYGNVLHMKGASAAGEGELLIGWSGTSGAHAPVFIRSRRDHTDAAWSAWAQVYTSRDSIPGVNATGNQNTTGNAATATKLQTARTIGGVSFDGTANINLPGVNVAGNQNTSGNAATATKLQTARTINGVSFDGSKNIELTPRSIGTINSTTMSFRGGTGWFRLATVTMPQASSVVYISLIGGAGYNVNSPMQAGISELVLRAGNGNPKGLTGALWRRTSVGFTNFAWVNTSGDTYDVYVEIGNYATGVNIQWDYTSNASVTIHTSPTYTANKPTGLTDGTVYVIYSSHIKPTAADVGALSLSGGQLNGALGIGTSSALGGNSIVLGDNDTGFKQNGDGNLDVYANNVHVMRFVSGSIQSNKTINITGRVNPTDYGNFDSRYVRDIRLGGAATYKPANNGMTWTHQAPSGCIYSGIIVQDTGSNSADNIGGVYYRPVQKYINGTWYNVAQV
ncbi:TPA: tail fiber protein [Escherichia coli]|nr:tail fiber protein [Escherichia coli]